MDRLALAQSWLQGADVPLGHHGRQRLRGVYARCGRIVPADGRPAVTGLPLLPKANAEWRVAFASDPDGSDRRIVPLRIEEVDPPGLLKGRVHADLFGTSKEIARERLLNAISGPTGPPKTSRRSQASRSPRRPPRSPGSRVRPRSSTSPRAIRTSPAVPRAWTHCATGSCRDQTSCPSCTRRPSTVSAASARRSWRSSTAIGIRRVRPGLVDRGRPPRTRVAGAPELGRGSAARRGGPSAADHVAVRSAAHARPLAAHLRQRRTARRDRGAPATRQPRGTCS